VRELKLIKTSRFKNAKLFKEKSKEKNKNYEEQMSDKMFGNKNPNTSGMRQECSLSPLLFNIVLEFLEQ
jgi:phage portal protein BeeE